MRRTGTKQVAAAVSIVLYCGAAPAQTKSHASAPEERPGAQRGTWIGELNGGVPSLKSGDLKLIGNARLGYLGPLFGAVGRGGLAVYDVESSVGATQTLREEGYADGWFQFGEPRDPLRLEVWLSGGAALYTSTYVPNAGVANAGFFHDEDSLMFRGSGLLGLSVEPNQRFIARLRVGGGAQFETYDYLSVDPADTNLLTSTDHTSARGEGHLYLRWRFLPEMLSARTQADVSFFSITRSSLAVGQVGGSVDLSESQFTQIDFSGRLFIDIDAAQFFGIRPAAFGGLDYIAQRADGGSVSTLIPVVGVGLLKTE